MGKKAAFGRQSYKGTTNRTPNTWSIQSQSFFFNITRYKVFTFTSTKEYTTQEHEKTQYNLRDRQSPKGNYRPSENAYWILDKG